MASPGVAIVHDYLTQRGGAERVTLSLVKAFPDAPLYTSVYDPDGTFPEFRNVDVRTLQLNRMKVFRRHHRLLLPLLAPAFSRLVVDSDLVICSSSGWAHGVRTTGRKVVYCHTPARWLYQPDRYVSEMSGVTRLVRAVLAPHLREWDQRAAKNADLYLANSTVVRSRIESVYGRCAEVVPAPHSINPCAEHLELPGVAPGFFLAVSRLLSYKNVGAVVDAFNGMPDSRLVVVGSGPLQDTLRATAGGNVRLVGTVSDPELRWLYHNCTGLIAASFEDYGLTPLEAACFGKPTAALRWGGFLDTVTEGKTGVFFDTPNPDAIRAAVHRLLAMEWDCARLMRWASEFSEARFVDRIRVIAQSVLAPNDLDL